MTPKERAAMQQALEALELYGTDDMAYIKSEKAITALREALANTRSSIRSTSEYSEQVEQEPIRFIWNGEGWIEADDYIWKTTDDHERRILYAAPVRTKDLTDDEIRFWIGRFPFLLNEKSEKWVIGLARVIIAADREKNK